MCTKILKIMPVDAYNASIILKFLHTPSYYAQNSWHNIIIMIMEARIYIPFPAAYHVIVSSPLVLAVNFRHQKWDAIIHS